MLTNRYAKIFSGLLILMVAFVSVNIFTAGISSKNGSGKNLAVSNTYLPLPPGKQTQLFNAAREARINYHGRSSRAPSVSAVYSDYFERHAELSNLAALGQGASDYAERHPGLAGIAISRSGASDYFERHPELSAKAALSVDLSDYYFRHLSK